MKVTLDLRISEWQWVKDGLGRLAESTDACAVRPGIANDGLGSEIRQVASRIGEAVHRADAERKAAAQAYCTTHGTTSCAADKDTRFDPALHHVGYYRMCRNPVEGVIENIQTFDGIDIATYRADGSSAQLYFRVLLPENPIRQKSVMITRAEGKNAGVGKSVTLRPRAWNDRTQHALDADAEDYDDSVVIPPLLAANVDLERWGVTAPKEGTGYDKCDFTVTWGDKPFLNKAGTVVEVARIYKGRFDLQYGGKAGGRTLSEQVHEVLMQQAGLLPTPAGFMKDEVDHYQRRMLYLGTLTGTTGEARRMVAALDF